MTQPLGKQVLDRRTMGPLISFYRPLGSARVMVAREELLRWIRLVLSQELPIQPIGVPEIENDRPSVLSCG